MIWLREHQSIPEATYKICIWIQIILHIWVNISFARSAHDTSFEQHQYLLREKTKQK